MKEFKLKEITFNEFKLKEETKVLTKIEFKDKKHIVLDKFTCTYVMNREGEAWALFEIEKQGSPAFVQSIGLTNDEAYEFYLERMASYGFKQFPIIEE